ncbi:MAG: isocitrate lyase/phosphoenolpyruvate mutase family protein, partial [Nitrospinae bacterium]|nr:isocitrate lyase/phosphoenolpyruvate mutase family protein [Nitrospinota bacterium]
MADSVRKKFRKILERPGATIIPGAHDALTARLIASKGFEAVYMSGAGVVNALAGLPDNGLASFSEVLMNARYMADTVDIPLYGNAVNVVRTVRDFERAGVACIQIEDQVLPKRCGHLDGKQVVSRDEFIGKIRAAVAHRTDPDFAIMARIDAKYIHGMGEAVARGKAALNAGADVIFIEALETRDEFIEYAERCPGPLLANMTEFGKTPHISKADFEKMGYKLVLFP